MSERKTSLQNEPYRDSGGSHPSIQQIPANKKAAARGDGLSSPVLFVESLSLDDLLERAELDAEAEFWPSAVMYADRALSIDPRSARAYLYKLLADLKVKTPDQLKNQKRPFDSNPNYLKIMSLDDAGIKNMLADSNRYICDHLSELYSKELDEIRHTLAYAEVVSDLAPAEQLLQHIPAFPASDQLREEYSRKKQELFRHTSDLAENCARQGDWEKAVSLMESISYDEKSRVRLLEYRGRLETDRKYRQGVAYQENNQFREAAETFAALEGYKDSPERLRRCNRMIKGNKVRAVGKEHTKAAWANVFLSAFMALACAVNAPSSVLLSLLWGIPLMIASAVMTIIRARYRPAKRMWMVMGAVAGLFVLLAAFGVLPLAPAANAFPSLICLAMTLCLIFV